MFASPRHLSLPEGPKASTQGLSVKDLELQQLNPQGTCQKKTDGAECEPRGSVIVRHLFTIAWLRLFLFSTHLRTAQILDQLICFWRHFDFVCHDFLRGNLFSVQVLIGIVVGSQGRAGEGDSTKHATRT